jgi:hypothetical protein
VDKILPPQAAANIEETKSKPGMVAGTHIKAEPTTEEF